MHKKRLPDGLVIWIIALSRIAEQHGPNGVSSTLLLWCGFNAALVAAFFLAMAGIALTVQCPLLYHHELSVYLAATEAGQDRGFE
ncbi:MAG: hypothetical protein RBT55_07070 [Rhodocyclaceae bacterium]|jgi:hypothetical protein|nr:hypothetical protein [Rhodocyclaceae bacterium]